MVHKYTAKQAGGQADPHSCWLVLFLIIADVNLRVPIAVGWLVAGVVVVVTRVVRTDVVVASLIIPQSINSNSNSDKQAQKSVMFCGQAS